jgi:hypothetical protein
MAPQGRFAGAGVGVAAGAAGFGAAACEGAAAGAAGAPGLTASRCVTLLDCCPTDLPPPIRRAASAFKVPKVKTRVKTMLKNLFTVSPNIQKKTINI